MKQENCYEVVVDAAAGAGISSTVIGGVTTHLYIRKKKEN